MTTIIKNYIKIFKSKYFSYEANAVMLGRWNLKYKCSDIYSKNVKEYPY